MTDRIEIPFRAYWSTPFARWQGAFSGLHAVEFAAHCARASLDRRKIPVDAFDHAVLGATIPQHKSFWGVPWLMSRIGNPAVGGPTVSQACATSVKAIAVAANDVAAGDARVSLVVACDRTSNGPVLTYPAPGAPGGAPTVENWVLDNFADDPNTRLRMVDTAENVARELGIDRQEQDDLTLRRYAQYGMALADGAGFLARFMTLPFEVPDPSFRRTVTALTGDEGIHDTTREGLARLKPVREGGTVTYGAQTHPADGNAGIVVTTRERARELSSDPGISIRLLGFGAARERPGFMPLAPVKAARAALARAGLSIDRIDAIKSHNPFAVNDIAFARETGADPDRINNYGCSLVYGHPQGPTGMRGIIELIEELAARGGGRGLFQGCAAGDTAMSVALEVVSSRKA